MNQNVQSIRTWALSTGTNPRTAARIVKRLGIGTPVCNGRVILLTKEEYDRVLKSVKK